MGKRITLVQGAVDSGKLHPPNFRANALSLFGMIFGCPTDLVQLHPSFLLQPLLVPTQVGIQGNVRRDKQPLGPGFRRDERDKELAVVSGAGRCI